MHRVIIVVIIASMLPVIFTIEPSFDLVSWESFRYVVARQAGLIGTLLLMWQFLLGIRGVVTRFTTDLIWVNNLHKFLGKYGFLIIAIHPVLIVINYLSNGINLLLPKLENEFDLYKTLGTIAFTLTLFIWVTSALLRSKMSFRLWKRLHFATYIILPLVIIHGLNLGLTLNTVDWLNQYWTGLSALLTIAVTYRFFSAAGLLKQKFTVADVTKLSNDTHQVLLTARGNLFKARPGQFVYVQFSQFGEAHPYTISHYLPDTLQIAISAKSLGKFSANLGNLTVGQTAYVEGPYGVFTQEAYTTPRDVVLVAGGIGITPFLAMIKQLASGWDKSVTLIWGNKTEQDIVYSAELANAASNNPKFKLVHVLSNQPDFAGEKGYIDTNLIKKYFGDDIARYDFFVCGPPVMMNKLIPDLKSHGVPETQIYAERFSV